MAGTPLIDRVKVLLQNGWSEADIFRKFQQMVRFGDIDLSDDEIRELIEEAKGLGRVKGFFD